MIIKQINAKEILIYSLFVRLMAGLTFAMSQIVVENSNKVLA